MKDINLIPKSYINEKKNKLKKTYLSILILCVGFAVVMVYVVPTVYEYNLTSEKTSLEQQVSQTNNFVVLEKEFNSLKQAIEAREQEGKLLSLKKLNVLGTLNAIEAAAPEKLYIQKFDSSGLSEDDLNISLTGVANNEDTIASFIRNLIDDGYFIEVILTSVVNNQGNNGSSFDITLTGINKSNLTIYIGWDSGFTIGYQADWIIKSEKDNKVLFEDNKQRSTAKPATLEVTVEDTEQKDTSFIEAREAQLKKLKNYEHVYSKKTENSTEVAYKLMYYADEDNIRYQYLELCTVKDKKSYIVTYRCDPTSFANNARTIDRILKSFKIN